MPAGRPEEFDKKKTLEKLCDYMAEGTRSLQQICDEEEDMPVRSWIYTWCAHDDELMNIFMRAKRLWCMAQSDEIVRISDDQSRDISPDGKSDNTAVNRDKLRVGSRQWSMARFNPDLFGDRVKQEHSGSVEVIGNVFKKDH